MSEFTASNGVKVERIRTASLLQRVVVGPAPHDTNFGGETTSYLQPNQAEALAEFFQHERDEELGRWRWPENPECVVYPPRKGVYGHGRGALVIHEPTARMFDVWEVRSVWSVTPADVRAVADAYFAAHPEPKPWHDAKPGEVWILTLRGEEYGAVREFGNDFKLSNGNLLWLKHEGITAGRRIYPESAS